MMGAMKLNPFLVNVIDTPGQIDFSAEVTSSLRVSDGALLVVDCIEGVCLQTEKVLQQALAEKIKPVMFINKIDKCIFELQADGEAIYQSLQRIITDANTISSVYEFKEEGQSDQFNPSNGNVAFGSAQDGWAFTLSKFTKTYAAKFKLDHKKLMQRFWGENYYNVAAKSFQNTPEAADGKALMRTFVQFIMRPII